MTASDIRERRATMTVGLGWVAVMRALTTPRLHDVQDVSPADWAKSRSLYRQLLLAAAAVALAGAALVQSSGLVASVDAAHSGPPATSGASQNLQPNAEAAESGPAGESAVDADAECCGDDHMWGWGNGWWWLVMPIGMVIFWGGIIALIVWAIRQFTGGRGGVEHPIDIARTRYAKGEISREEFERLRRDLA